MADILFRRVQPRGDTPDTREFIEAEARLERVINRVVSQPWNQGIFLEGVLLTQSRENLVHHGLGRSYISWFLCDRTAAVTVWRYSASTADDSLYLPLMTTVTTTVDLVVF